MSQILEEQSQEITLGDLLANDVVFRPTTPKEHVAYWISQIGSPPLTALGVLVLGGVLSHDATYWLWSGFYLLFAMVFPLLYLYRLVRQEHINDMEIQLREQRSRPFLLTLLGLTVAWTALYFGHAPAALQLLAEGSLLQGLVLYLITLYWKISVHTTTISGMVMMTVYLLGWQAWPLWLAIPLVGWSRVVLKRHTPWQVTLGVLVGLSSFGMTLYLFPLVR